MCRIPKRLDYVDIFYCHRYDPETPVVETLRVIDDLIRQGKILYAGVSMWTAAQIEEAVAGADQYLLDRIIVNQPEYNILNRSIEKEVIPVSEKYGIGQVVFSPLAQGVLTGKYRGGVIPEDSRGANEEINQWVKELIAGGVLERVDQLEDIARELGISLAQLSLAWILRESNIASALVGASRPEQVDENVKAVEVELSDDVTARIDELFPVN